MARAGRPKGWSPKTGWNNAGLGDQVRDRRTQLRADIEALFCAQVERVQTMLAHRYGNDYDGKIAAHSVGRMMAGNHFHVMPQNDGMSRKTIYQDCAQEVRK